ncbi:PIN domain-containing protein [Paucidesulfovibrio longus]|uniref:hypothetical protein n=1 Tax=Paucidesulfovibrio longus TaxID=889 RepID=UPI0003B6CD5B|nr:hypothetical protein [Paucidesulfovibrio longus]
MSRYGFPLLLLWLLIGLAAPPAAESCQEDFEWGVNRMDNAEAAADRKDWAAAEEYYKEAVYGFERAAQVCDADNAAQARENADLARKNVRLCEENQVLAQGNELSQQASDAFHRGVEQFGNGKYPEAANSFAEAERLYRSASTKLKDGSSALKNADTAAENAEKSRRKQASQEVAATKATNDALDEAIDDASKKASKEAGEKEGEKEGEKAFARKVLRIKANTYYELGLKLFGDNRLPESQKQFEYALAAYSKLLPELKDKEREEAADRIQTCEAKLALIRERLERKADAATVGKTPPPADCMTAMRRGMELRTQCGNAGKCPAAAEAFEAAAAVCTSARAKLARDLAEQLR